MERQGIGRTVAALVAGICLAWAGAAAASAFTEGGADLWSARAERFVHAFRDRAPGVSTQEALGQACEGIGGEMFRYGMYKTQVPNHASQGFRRLCDGIAALNGEARGRVKVCKEFRAARKLFARIDAEEAPARVVDLNERFLLKMIDALVAQGERDGWPGC
ncbi:hypothetical protein [Arenimonas sp.]|uniref:hypothetical protein n=1 Tax=Arenimonas sp. TaxID=1872635 RepID=UPI0035B33D47